MSSTKNTATSIAKLLQRQRLQYRSFGPYWWPVKALLRANGFGETLRLRGRDHDDPRAVEWFRGRTFADIIGEGLEHHQAQATRGTPLEVEHTTPDGNEQYHLHDEDME